MKNILSFAFVFAAVMAVAEPAITKQAVRQRWPFSDKVDIDLYLDSDANSDVELTATWDGQATPVRLSEEQLEGSVNLRPGFNHLVWDPLAAGLGESKLTGFTVTATLASFDSRKFLVIDLKNRTWQYYADDPEANEWRDAKYKYRYIVFRRVPAGTYQVGYTDAQLDHLLALGASSSYRAVYGRCSKARSITISKDYYIAIYQLTSSQVTSISWFGTKGSGGANGYYYGERYVVKDYSPTDKNANGYNPMQGYGSYWRGCPTNEALHCTWPQDGHAVQMPEMTTDDSGMIIAGKSSGSLIGRIRKLMELGSQNLPSNMVIDLPTQEQWEIAARAGSPLYWDGFGTLETTKDEIVAYKAARCHVGGGDVGEMLPNIWGLFDTLGIGYEFALNNVTYVAEPSVIRNDYVTTFDESQTTDPVGFTCAPDKDLFMVACQCGYSWSGVDYGNFPTNRRLVRPDTGDKCVARLCIHLK